MQRHENAEHGIERQVVTLEMHQFVFEHEASFRRSENIVKMQWKQQGRMQQAGYGGAMNGRGHPNAWKMLKPDLAGDLCEGG